MKVLLLALAALILLIALAWCIGALLPREHTATRSIVLRQSAATLFDTARDFARHAEWRRDIRAIELFPLESPAAPVRYRETSSHGAIVYQLHEADPPHRLVTEIADDTLPFGGRWTITFAPADEGRTSVRITEDGFVRPALFRFLARFVFGHTRTMESYLRQLGEKFGESPTLEP